MKYISYDEGPGFDENARKFLTAIDDGMGEFSTEVQTQLNDIYGRLEGSAPLYQKSKDFAPVNDWCRAFLRKDFQKMKELETKLETWPSHVLHTGGNSNIDGGSVEQGAYLIPELLAAEIARLITIQGIARRDMKYMPFAGPGNERRLPVQLSGPSVYWVQEGGVKPPTKPVIGQVVQTLEKLACIVILTDDILEDSAVDLVQFISTTVAEAIAAEEDRVFFAGQVADGDPFDGILHAAGTVPAVLQPGLVGANMRPEHLLAMTTLIPSGMVSGAKFYMHREIFAALRAYRSDAVAADDQRGGYLVQSPTASQVGSLWGYPVELSDALPGWDDIQVADEPVLFFGNLSRCAVYGDKLGLRIKLLTESTVTDAGGNSINLAERDMQAVRIHKRCGFVPLLPGGICVLHTGPVS